MLITSAPWSAAQSTPRATAADEQVALVQTRTEVGDPDRAAVAAVFTRVALLLEAADAAQAETAIAVLRQRAGLRSLDFARNLDEPDLWTITARWDDVGSYRRALSAAEVKISGAPVWVHALDEPGVYVTE